MIELRGVSKTVQSGGRPLTILHPLDFSIASGEFVAIVGPSGSGKSTLLGLLAGLDAPSTGAIKVDGVDITRLGEDALARLDRFKGRIPNLFENYVRIRHLSVSQAEAAILEPLRRHNQLLPDQEPWTAEPELVRRVLDGVRVGRVVLAVVGRGAATALGLEVGSEAWVLQIE